MMGTATAWGYPVAGPAALHQYARDGEFLNRHKKA